MLNNSSQSSQNFAAVSFHFNTRNQKMSLESKAIEDINRALENNDTQAAASISQTYLRDLDSIPLNIAVTGESGSGKSTCVNAFRGIDNRDERAAQTDVVETTMKPKAYPHPIYPNVTFWDLPGIGTTKFPAHQYLKHVEFEKFDFFIIVSSDRFKENDAKLAQEIMKMGKTFYFVRAKIDNNLHSAKNSQKEYDEEKTLQKIKENCIQGLEERGVTAPQVFLVSNFDLCLYDFPTLQETMERDLPSHKRDILILAHVNIGRSNIKKNKEVFHSQIKFYALTFATFHGILGAIDLGIMSKVITQYLFQFGLDKKSLEKLSSDTGKPLDELEAILKCTCSGKDITKELLGLMLREMSLNVIPVAAEEVIRWIPFVGLPIAAALSYHVISRFLSHVLDSLAVDAENVLIKAFDIQ